MKVLIVTFSGTGNTKKIAEAYRSALIARGAEADCLYLPLQEEPDYGAYDLIGIGYPIHGFNAPANVLAFAKSLPNFADGKRAFIFKSSGEPVRMSDVSSLKLIRILKKKGVSVLNEYQYVMPYNIIFRHTDAEAYRMWETAQRLVPADCAEILAGKPRRVKRMFLGGFLAWVLRIEHWGARFNGKRYRVNDRCIHCNKCVKNCPAHNIWVSDKGDFRFGKECLMCMRCSFLCPADAIKIGFFGGWKVNGAYSFAKPENDAPVQKNGHEKYCAKAYERYYAEAEKRIAAYEKAN